MNHKPIRSERQLAQICRGLLPTNPEITLGEWSLLKSTNKDSNIACIAACREAIEAGDDPLGDAFIVLRSADERRSAGATYTPDRIVDAMVRWAAKHGTPGRVVDPGSGSGRFLLAAADAFPEAQLIAIEQDPLAALMLRANLSARKLTNRATVIVENYCEAQIGSTRGRTLFIGNPPYIRHHNISPKNKKWFEKATAELGIHASKLAGLHVYFFLRTAQLAKPNDYGVFITSSEWLDVNYGSALRELLTSKLSATGIHVIEPSAIPFQDAMTTGTITCFQAGSSEQFKMRSVKSLDKLNGLNSGSSISRAQALKTNRWTTLLRAPQKVPNGYVELGELCRVHRGQVTGDNSTWVEGPHSSNLPKSVLFPAVTKGRELLTLSNNSALRHVIDIPEDLETLPAEHRRAVKEFIDFARSRGAHKSYTARHRRAWWSVGLRAPAPILVGYMARRAPTFVRNVCQARHINIAHGLYPRDELAADLLDKLANWLNANVRVESGRTYAGGLVKFEPGELERLMVPRPEMIV